MNLQTSTNYLFYYNGIFSFLVLILTGVDMLGFGLRVDILKPGPSQDPDGEFLSQPAKLGH